ncbi:MAG: erythromycin biosynthesis sensory transduction protein eryC1 [Planctomycetaceae bacterium]|nr:erythromycin biosynthesis sensory transduction protein eryC1 [Planctomycetaceae bacterium]
MTIPFVDLKSQYQTIKSEIDLAMQNVINESAFVRGRHVERFESDYKSIMGTDHCITCGNGTDALYISLKALGIGPGDEVITTALSWISTSEVITQCGARVVFADIEAGYLTIDPEDIERKITENTRAIIPVHLHGQAANMEAIVSIAEQHNLHIIEDCAQSHLGKYQGQNLGTFGVAGTFSFYPSKNLGAFGDAGAIISNDDDFAKKARMFANHGALKKPDHMIEGINSRMDGIQAAILSVKLKYLSKWNERRKQLAEYYTRSLANISSIITPKVRLDSEHVFHLYVIQTDERDRLKSSLLNHRVSTSIHYPTALPFLHAYKYLGHENCDFPIASGVTSKILSLPMYPELRMEQTEKIVDFIRSEF